MKTYDVQSRATGTYIAREVPDYEIMYFVHKYRDLIITNTETNEIFFSDNWD